MSPILALATVAGVIASGWPLALLACHLDPGPRAHRRKDRTTVKPDHLATLAATEEEMRDPEWCHRHGCHSSRCPQGGDQ